MRTPPFSAPARPPSHPSARATTAPAASALAAAALLLIATALWPASARAQYMYLDSNGDGVHSAADQLNPADPTTFDIWINTAANRDGTPAVCDQGSEPLSIISYQVILRAVGGTVSWSGFTDRFTNGGFDFGEQSSTTEFCGGFGTPTKSPPGLYRLASLTVTVLSGSPSLEIVDAGPTLPSPVYALTMFGTECLGIEYNNTYTLDQDWYDVDGLAPGAPMPGSPPVLVQPATLVAPVGAVTSQTLTATDADGQPVTISEVSGPPYLWVEMVDPGRGTATATAYAAPIYTDVGTSSATIQATDGVFVDQKTFAVTVTAVANRAPVIAPLGRIVVVAGTTALREIRATDADGQPVQFSMISGPTWARVTTLHPGRGAGTAALRLTPAPGDVGAASVVVSATDGSDATQRTFDISVLPVSPRPSPSVLPWPPGAGANDVAIGDLDGDGIPDLVGGRSQFTTVALGNGDGSFLPSVSYDAGGHVNAVAVGDLNRDGRMDVVALTDPQDRLVVLRGNGDGTLSPASSYPVGTIPDKAVLRDLNGDGILDAAVASGGNSYVTIYLGQGDGTFGARHDYATDGLPADLAIGDFDSDGRLDIATGNLGVHSVSILFGLGDGSFGRRADLAADGGLVAAGDWNGDGVEDLAVGSGSEGVRTYLGVGDGTFQPGPTAGGPINLGRAVPVDWNADGNLDLVYVNADIGTMSLLEGSGDGSFSKVDALGNAEYTLAVGDLDGDGFPDAAAEGITVLNLSSPRAPVAARAFLENPNRTISLSPGGPDFCIRLEPVDGTYSNAEVDMTSLTLSAPGAGTESIHALPDGNVVEEDTDGNGVPDIPVCFTSADLSQLFSTLRGRQPALVTLQGTIARRHFSASLTVTVSPIGKPLAIAIAPNPVNPAARVTVSTAREGYLRIRLFDARGRLVRTVVDSPSAPAGVYEYRLDVGGATGRLASGVYYLRMETPDGVRRARITILK